MTCSTHLHLRNHARCETPPIFCKVIQHLILRSSAQDYPNVDAETIRNAFSPNAMACGIRTLPNALAPDFRSKLMEEVISRSKYFFSHGHGHPSLPSGSYFEEPVTAFGSPPRKEHPLNNTFSMYRYEPSPYNAARVAAQQHRRTQAWRYGDSEFKVAVPPMPVGAQTAFNSYEYPHEPYTKVRAAASCGMGRAFCIAQQRLRCSECRWVGQHAHPLPSAQ